MRGGALIAEILSAPWALMPERMAAFASVIARWSASAPVSAGSMFEVRQAQEKRAARRDSTARAGGGAIAVLPLYGVMTQRDNMVDAISGAGSCSIEQFTASLRSALQDDSVSKILIDIDSPGGSVYGVSELASEIYRSRGVKPVVAIANSVAASAAYWVGAAASEFYVTPGGEVGSIGVWTAHDDISAAMAEAGIKTTLISAGKYKTEGNMYGPLDEDALGFMQSRVDDYYSAFTKSVARGRGVPIDSVRRGMGQGRVLGADQALAERMVDDVATFDDVIAKMRRAGSASVGATSSARRIASEAHDRRIELLELAAGAPVRTSTNPAGGAAARQKYELQLRLMALC